MQTASIARNPQDTSGRDFDLIIIGAGVYGTMICLEAVHRGLKPLLLDKADFGAATTFNWLRILHGGFRYLQTMDLHRFFESVTARRWFLQHMPDRVQPLACLMPLYGEGLRHPHILRIASKVNDLLSLRRNQGVRADRHLPAGRMLNNRQTAALFPAVDPRGLKGGTLWYDACMPDAAPVLYELLAFACRRQATALNYVEAIKPLVNGDHIVGLRAVDRISGESLEFRSHIVINACGPWSQHLAAQFSQDQADLFKPSLAWNLFLAQRPPSSAALALKPKGANRRTYFLYPWKNRLLVGTGHAPWPVSADGSTSMEPLPSERMIQDMLDDINAAAPALQLQRSKVQRVLAGLLPTDIAGSDHLAVREVIQDHGQRGGLQGFYSVSGVKFTTARLVAHKLLNRIYPNLEVRQPKWNRQMAIAIRQSAPLLTGFGGPWLRSLKQLCADPSVQHLDDLIFRRTGLWEDAAGVREHIQQICDCFDWSADQRRQEIRRTLALLDNRPLAMAPQIPAKNAA
jgi:glycerol-3-phosphate dehydrogenase